LDKGEVGSGTGRGDGRNGGKMDGAKILTRIKR
jgi:hypothetical protein